MHAGRRLAPTILISILVLATLSSCSDEPTAPKPEQLAGAWTATKAEYVGKTSGSRVDLVAEGGVVTLLLETNGNYVYVEIPSGASADTARGAWSASADVMQMTPEGMPYARQFDLDFAGNTLRLTGGDVLHEFSPGVLEESDLNLAFAR